ncbi:MAG: hypothetical protein CVV59_02320 [Tenericutes bacterium HGW-Tenericutes-4]|nr:MAG: hypothetical protein CVV59_02320 [Tenericutes bacterium HGW-Tenericutes-4]
MSLYDKYFTVITLWLLTLAVLVRMQIGVMFVLISVIGLITIVICASIHIKKGLSFKIFKKQKQKTS